MFACARDRSNSFIFLLVLLHLKTNQTDKNTSCQAVWLRQYLKFLHGRGGVE